MQFLWLFANFALDSYDLLRQACSLFPAEMLFLKLPAILAGNEEMAGGTI